MRKELWDIACDRWDEDDAKALYKVFSDYYDDEHWDEFCSLAFIGTNRDVDDFIFNEFIERYEVDESIEFYLDRDRIGPVEQNINTNKPEEEILGSSLEKEIQKIVEHDLPEKCRQVFILSRVENLSNNEISKKLGLSSRTVENQVYRAIKILRKKLKNYM